MNKFIKFSNPLPVLLPSNGLFGDGHNLFCQDKIILIYSYILYSLLFMIMVRDGTTFPFLYGGTIKATCFAPLVSYLGRHIYHEVYKVYV